MLTRAGRTGPASDAGRAVSDPSAAARVRVCRPAASGACRPRPPPAHAVPGREVGLHAQSSHPPPERVGLHPLRTPAPPAGRTPPPAGPGTAVRPPSRGREGRRPRDGRRTPALATAHPAGLKSGPARRVRLSQIPASRTGEGEERSPPLNARAVESPLLYLDVAGKERGFAAGRLPPHHQHRPPHHHRRVRRGAALPGRPA